MATLALDLSTEPATGNTHARSFYKFGGVAAFFSLPVLCG
jgi:hypothetical protein